MTSLTNHLQRRPSSALLIALLGLDAACTRAEFVPVSDGGTTADDASDTGQTSDANPLADAGAGDVRRDTVIICSAPSVPSCTGSGGTGSCDPVCQTGGCDWCTQKCSYVDRSGSGDVQPACTRAGAGVFPQDCAVVASGSPQQSDNCAPGSTCLPPIIGDSLTYCFGLCRSPADCAYGVECGQRKLSAAGGLVAVCDPPYDQCGVDGTCCDPLANSGCAANRVCLLVSPDLGSGHSRTVCEFSYGDGRNGSPCASARDCQIKNTCVNNACRQTCGSGAACAAGSTCTPLGSEFGYCS